MSYWQNLLGEEHRVYLIISHHCLAIESTRLHQIITNWFSKTQNCEEDVFLCQFLSSSKFTQCFFITFSIFETENSTRLHLRARNRKPSILGFKLTIHSKITKISAKPNLSLSFCVGYFLGTHIRDALSPRWSIHVVKNGNIWLP